MTIGREIERKVLRILEKSDIPVSTRDLSLKIGRAWHSVQHHCFRLQIAGRIDGFQVGRMNLWQIKKQDPNAQQQVQQEKNKNRDQDDHQADEKEKAKEEGNGKEYY